MAIDPTAIEPGPVDSPAGVIPPAPEATGKGGAGSHARVAVTRRQAFVQLSSVLLGVIAITLYIQLRTPPQYQTTNRVGRILEAVARAGRAGQSGRHQSFAGRTAHDGVETCGRDGPVTTRRQQWTIKSRWARQKRSSTPPAAIALGLTTEPMNRHRTDWPSPRARLPWMPPRRISLLTWCAILQPGSPGFRPAAGSFAVNATSSKKELSSLKQLPRPKSISILSKSPVARPATSDEFHFELKHNRISFINLNRLLELTKAEPRSAFAWAIARASLAPKSDRPVRSPWR